jgi:hypothetical protein
MMQKSHGIPFRKTEAESTIKSTIWVQKMQKWPSVVLLLCSSNGKYADNTFQFDIQNEAHHEEHDVKQSIK